MANKFDERYNQLLKDNKGGYRFRGFAILPHSLLADKRINVYSLMVFWVLTSHLFKGKDYCFPSIDTITKEGRMSRSTVIRSIKQLQKFGYLELEKEKGRVNKYYLKAKI